jgi:hypothetical protein
MHTLHPLSQWTRPNPLRIVITVRSNTSDCTVSRVWLMPFTKAALGFTETEGVSLCTHFIGLVRQENNFTVSLYVCEWAWSLALWEKPRRLRLRFAILMSAISKIPAFLDLTPYSLVDRYKRVGGTYFIRHQDSVPKMEAEGFLRNVGKGSARLHGVISQRTVMFPWEPRISHTIWFFRGPDKITSRAVVWRPLL